LSAWVLPVWNVASWSAVRCIVRRVVSVGNVSRSGSSSEGHHSKRTFHNSVYLSARIKLRGTNSNDVLLIVDRQIEFSVTAEEIKYKADLKEDIKKTQKWKYSGKERIQNISHQCVKN
jgi:hypothetical protein